MVFGSGWMCDLVLPTIKSLILKARVEGSFLLFSFNYLINIIYFSYFYNQLGFSSTTG